MNRKMLGVLLLLFSGSALAASNSTLRCGGNLLSVDDTKLDAIAKCGRPVLQETREEERVVKVYDWQQKVSRERRVTVTIDEWTYNFGPGQFIYVVRFENGKVVDVERGGYGYSEEELRR